MASFKLICAAVLLLAIAAPLTAEAIDCSFVIGKVAGCMTYLRGEIPEPSDSCCAGVSSLNNAASTTADRQTVCGCLKLAAQKFEKINLGLAGGLPNACKVNIPYKISPSTDCNPSSEVDGAVNVRLVGLNELYQYYYQ